ncbi:hypothetical protein SUGI_0965230 [Cryptomeria japonica]|nr:hypothetical protein SUGI_0965230 [Cryptomeria japonica]
MEKKNFDKGSKGNPGLSGFGVVIRDEEGNLVGVVCDQAGFVSNNIAKIATLEEGLKWATANCITKLVIEGDSKVILSRIIKQRFMNWWLKIHRLPHSTYLPRRQSSSGPPC